MTAIYEHRFTVPAEAIDGNGHVNNVEYVRWMTEAAHAHARACGGSEMVKTIGAIWVVRSHRIEYLRPLVLHDPVIVQTWVESFQRVVSLRRYRILSGGHLVARGETKWVLVDGADGRPRAIPRELVDLFGVCPGGPEAN
jgi:acyl-CoA thioester hydrolase